MPEGRGGASGRDTHIRYRWYLADAVVLLALTLADPDEAPTLSDLTASLRHPARPLFIGRKHCLPTAPVFLAKCAAETAEAALAAGLDLLDRAGLRRGPAAVRTEIDVRIAAGPAVGAMLETETLVDRRDWRNQMHTGTRQVRHEQLRRNTVPAG